MTDYIRNMNDLCDHFYADEPGSLPRMLYKYTSCGASISVYLEGLGLDEFGLPRSPFAIHNREEWAQLTRDTPIESFTIQTIVEGSDATVDSDPFVLPVAKEEVNQWVEYMESEAEYLWIEANEGEEE